MKPTTRITYIHPQKTKEMQMYNYPAKYTKVDSIQWKIRQDLPTSIVLCCEENAVAEYLNEKYGCIAESFTIDKEHDRRRKYNQEDIESAIAQYEDELDVLDCQFLFGGETPSAERKFDSLHFGDWSDALSLTENNQVKAIILKIKRDLEQ